MKIKEVAIYIELKEPATRTCFSKSSWYASKISHCVTFPEIVIRGGGSVAVPRSCTQKQQKYVRLKLNRK